MIVTTTENIKGYEVTEVLGAVFGVVVRARAGVDLHRSKDWSAGRSNNIPR